MKMARYINSFSDFKYFLAALKKMCSTQYLKTFMNTYLLSQGIFIIKYVYITPISKRVPNLIQSI